MLALQGVRIEFHGRPAHAAADPHNGINALNALIETFNGINALRQHITSDARIHGIITRGGDAPNVVPAFAAGEFLIRAATMPAMRELVDKVRRVNVSYLVPSVETKYPILDRVCTWHSREVVAAADSSLAYDNTVTVAKALALTGIDVLQNAQLRQQVRDEYAGSVPNAMCNLSYGTHA